MRRTIILALAAWFGGLCFAGASSWAYTKLNAWKGFGPDFQLGFVAGYLDGLKVGRNSDMRGIWVTTGGRADLEQWRDDVNAFYADPANAQKSVPDAFSAVGQKRREEMIRRNLERGQRGVSPAPDAASPAVPHTGP